MPVTYADLVTILGTLIPDTGARLLRPYLHYPPAIIGVCRCLAELASYSLYTGMNTLLKFANPLDTTEAGQRFMLVEHRGDRILVALIGEYWDNATIRPQAVYAAVDLVEA